MDILLIAGLWLDGSAWDNVAAQLQAQGQLGSTNTSTSVMGAGYRDHHQSGTLRAGLETYRAIFQLAD